MNPKVEKDWTTSAGPRAVCVLCSYDPPLSPDALALMSNSWRCGYVCLPENHPLCGHEHGKPADILTRAMEKAMDGPIGKRGIAQVLCAAHDPKPSPANVFDVHGSLSFSGETTFGDGWWYGFDCHHHDDDPLVQTTEYVVAECESLAEQLMEIVTCTD